MYKIIIVMGLKKIINKIKYSSRLKKYGIIIFVLLVVYCLSGVVYADASSSLNVENYALNISQLIKMVSQIVYVFIWPCLVIAGAALDNSLVYGSFLHLDVALWKIRNIMKNFANFALGFIFVFSIVKNLIVGSFAKEDPMGKAIETVKKTLVAGVLVQISRFLIAVLIDISSILIYAVGGIPLSMLGVYGENVAEIPIMKLNVQIDERNTLSYYSYGDYNYSPCLLANRKNYSGNQIIFSFPGMEDEYVVGRERLYLSDDITFRSGYCTLNGYLYKYVEMTGFWSGYVEASGSVSQKNVSYRTQLNNYIRNLAESDQNKILELKNSCSLVSAYNKEYTGTNCEELCAGYGEVSYSGDVFSETNDKFTLKSLLENSKGWVGPFVTMYSSILNYQDLVINLENNSAMGNLFGLLINTFFAFVLFIPIAILMVLLLIRVGFLWVVVAISPILILINFGPIKPKKEIEILKKFAPKEILTQIFSPVIVVFSVSLCIVFLSTIYKAKPNYDTASDTLSAFGIEKVSTQNDLLSNNTETNNCSSGVKNVSSETYSILGLVDVNINAQNYNHGKDMFLRVLMELLATGIVRFFMKFAIGMMGDKGKELFKTAEKLITNYPIIPLGKNGDKVGIGAFGIGEGNSGRFSNLVNNKIDTIVAKNEQDKILGQFFGVDNGKDEENENKKQVYAILNEVRAGKEYDNLNQEQQTLVNNYYGGDATVAKQIVDNIYNYNTDGNKSNVEKIVDEAKNIQKQSSDALNLTAEQLNMAVKNEEAWINWAASMIGGAVHTKDGVRMVSVVKGTETSGVPVYEIMTRDEYEKQWFGDSPQNVTLDVFNGWKESSSEEERNKYQKMMDSFAKLEKQYNELVSTNEDKLDGDKKNQYNEMQKFFDETTLEWLRKFNPDKFKDNTKG